MAFTYVKELQDTVEMMNSSDYKERFKAEYYQTKIRRDKLYKTIIKRAAGTLEFTTTCEDGILEDQLYYMDNYLKTLEIRAEIEKIDLM